MQTEKNFTTSIKKKYDLSNYIIQDRRWEILPGEMFTNEVRIIDRNDPSKHWNFRTNYSVASKASKAAEKWNKWIEDQGIELASGGGTETGGTPR